MRLHLKKIDTTTPYTVEDLAKAQQRVNRKYEWMKDTNDNRGSRSSWDFYDAALHRDDIEANLKVRGIIPYDSEHERVSAQLTIAFPRARSYEEVEFEGKRYYRRFQPGGRSLSGKTVSHWCSEWVLTQPLLTMRGT